MDWRQSFAERLATGFFAGVSTGSWFRLLRENRFAISPHCVLRAAMTTAVSPVNSFWKWVESLLYDRAIEQTRVEQPLFVLGHWRSGTTHLQALLAADPRFASPSLFEVFFPSTFLTTKLTGEPILNFALPRTRGFDNVQQTSRMPHEDEIAMCVLGGRTCYLSWAFASRVDFYDRFLTLRDCDPAEVEAWRRNLIWFLKKVSYKHRKPLVLKSPTHTARIGRLLEMFPDARFVHICRDPYDVFRSTMRLTEFGVKITRLQSTANVDWTDRALRLYREMYDAYFAERKLIPAERLVEIRYEDLEADPLGQLRMIYQSLALPDFALAEPHVKKLLEGIGDYRKNRLNELPEDLRARIAEQWSEAFAQFGYSV